MLSDRGIRDYINQGLLKVEPLYRIGPASIDLHIGDQLYRSTPQAHLLYQEEIRRLAEVDKGSFVRKLEEPSMPFDQYVVQFGEKVVDVNSCWTLEPNNLYYTQTKETIKTQKNVRIWIATRSSSARNGFRIQFSEDKLDRGEEFEGKPFLVIETYGTHIELPENHSVCQIVVNPSRYLLAEEIIEVMKKGDITVSGNPIVNPISDSIILTFHPRLLRYNGRLLNPVKDSNNCFEEIDITHGYVLEAGRFYLASTQETVGISRRYVGILHELFGPYYTHLNAPYHWPGSNHHITLEIFSREPRLIKAGNPACRLHIRQLYPECEFSYNSIYSGQDGPTVSRMRN